MNLHEYLHMFDKYFSDPGLFVYCCDFSSVAIDIVKVQIFFRPWLLKLMSLLCLYTSLVI